MSTIGVALAVPDPWARELQDYRVSLGDRSASGIPTHITLVPPSEVPAADVPGIEDHLARAAAACEPFGIHLRGTGTFRPVSPVVFVTVAEGISHCEQLAALVRRGPLDVELAYPYHPHVTVAHDLAEEALDRAFADLEKFECVYEATEFHLYRHDDQTGWQPTKEFPLGGEG